MTVGLNPTIANQLLDSLFSAAAFTPPAASYVQLHTGDPGVAGTSNISSYTTRTVLTWASAAGGQKSISSSVTITASWAGTNGELITHVSYWDALTVGTFIISDQLLAPVTAVTGSPVTIPNLLAILSPIAA